MSALMAAFMPFRSEMLFRLCLVLAVLWLGGARADAYPDRPIHLIVPFPPGGPGSVVAEIIAPPLGERLGQKVVVENRSGVDGIVGSDAVANAAPDGYTLLLATSSHVIHPATYNSLPFDTETAFAPVSLLVTTQYVLVVNPSLPVESVEELIGYAKRYPGNLTYAAGGLGGPSQMAFELFKTTAGITAAPIAYEGGADALRAVVKGDAEMMMAPLISAIPLMQEGKLRGLAVTGRHPAPAAPELPTIAETLPGYSAVSWYGVLAPAGTPAAVINRLNTELDRIVHEPEMQKRFASIGGEAIGGPPATLASLIRGEIPRWRRVAKDAGIHIE